MITGTQKAITFRTTALCAAFVLLTAMTACKNPSALASGANQDAMAGSSAPAANYGASAATVASPVARRRYHSSYASTEAAPRVHRTWQKSAVIIGSSAGTGALIGGIAKGKKGAAVGAIAGGAAGFIYDQLTRNRQSQ
jgi:hypothetical protein